MDDQGAGLEAAADQRWYPGLDLRFEYWLNGRCDSSSWPCCFKREPGELITEEDIRSDKNPTGASPELLGQWWYIAELAGVVSPGDFSKRSNSDHYWGEYRNMGASAVASTGYGLSIAALAEATDGVIASWDSAFDSKHNGETAEQFLAWWGTSDSITSALADSPDKKHQTQPLRPILEPAAQPRRIGTRPTSGLRNSVDPVAAIATCQRRHRAVRLASG